MQRQWQQKLDAELKALQENVRREITSMHSLVNSIVEQLALESEQNRAILLQEQQCTLRGDTFILAS